MLFKNVSSDFSFKGHDGVALFNFGSYDLQRYWTSMAAILALLFSKAE